MGRLWIRNSERPVAPPTSEAMTHKDDHRSLFLSKFGRENIFKVYGGDLALSNSARGSYMDMELLDVGERPLTTPT